MEVILIDPDKLKIMLTAPDMQRYALDTARLEGMTCTDTRTREAFRHIFHDAETETGFHTEGARLLVQMYTSKCGGCEIFVTKLVEEPGEDTHKTTQQQQIHTGLSPEETALVRRILPNRVSNASSNGKEITSVQHLSSNQADKTATPSHKVLKRIVVTVEDMETLLSLCRRLLSIGYANAARVYIEKDRTPHRYHLCLEVPDGIFYTLDETYAFLKEYGEVKSHRHTFLMLDEYGELICKQNAVSFLGKL